MKVQVMQMAKDANPGELRTPVIIESYIDTPDADGYVNEVWTNIFGEDSNPIKIKWVNLHGSEVYEAMSLDLKDGATLTMRYSPRINQKCRILKLADYLKTESDLEERRRLAFEVISMDDVDERGEWLELKVQRMVKAK